MTASQLTKGTQLILPKALLPIGVFMFACMFHLLGHGQEQSGSLKVRAIDESGTLDERSRDNLSILMKLAEQSDNGKLTVWVVVNVPYDATIEGDSHASDTQMHRVIRERDEIVRQLELDASSVGSPAFGPYFHVDVDPQSMMRLIRHEKVKGFWGLY